MKKKLVIGGTTAIILIAGYWLFFRGHTASAVQYRTATVQKGSLFFTVTGSGTAVAAKSANLSPQVSGTVGSLAVSVGDTVKAGQTLMTVTNDQLDVQVAQAYGSYVQAKQGYSQATTGLMQAQLNQSTVAGDPKSSQAQIDIANQQAIAAQAALDTAKQNQASAWQNYQYQVNNAAKRTVTAPIDGVITTLNYHVGDTVNAGGVNQASSSPIVIQDLSTLQASVAINEADVSQVKPDQKVSVTFDAISGLISTGKVTHIDTVGSSSQGVVTYNALVAFDALDSRVKPGMSLSAVVTTNIEDNVLSVPSAAVKTSGGSQYVQVLQNGQPQQVTVTAGDSNGTSTVITEGLSEGQTVITQAISASAASNTGGGTLGGGAQGAGALRALSGGSGGGGGRFFGGGGAGGSRGGN